MSNDSPENSEEVITWRQRLYDQLLSGNRPAAVYLANMLADTSYPLAFIYTGLFRPVLYAFGDECAQGRLSSAIIHVAGSMVHTMLAVLYHRRVAGIELVKPSVIISCVPGNLHEIGPRMVADLLEEARYRTIYLAPPVERSALLELIFKQRPAAIALSTSMTSQLPDLTMLVDLLRNGGYRGKIVADGRALSLTAFSRVTPGIDWSGSDPVELISWLDHHMTKTEQDGG